jgi:hypothetical protein
MDIAEKMAADIALAMDGGEWKDGKWYSKFHRDAWIKAVKPYANEIERLREENARQRQEIMLLNSMIQTEHEIIRVAALKENE